MHSMHRLAGARIAEADSQQGEVDVLCVRRSEVKGCWCTCRSSHKLRVSNRVVPHAISAGSLIRAGVNKLSVLAPFVVDNPNRQCGRRLLRLVPQAVLLERAGFGRKRLGNAFRQRGSQWRTAITKIVPGGAKRRPCAEIQNISILQ